MSLLDDQDKTLVGYDIKLSDDGKTVTLVVESPDEVFDGTLFTETLYAFLEGYEHKMDELLLRELAPDGLTH
jgi:hypothetical protein